MKRRLFMLLVIVMGLLMMCAAAFAEAGGDPVKVEIEPSETSFTGPKEITVSVKVTNMGDVDLPGAVTLYYPNGKPVEEFGSPILTAGHSKSWSGTWMVTEEQLEKGKLGFVVRYSYIGSVGDGSVGDVVTKQVADKVVLTREGGKAGIEVNRSITPSAAAEGQEVTVVYEIVNSGNIDLTNLQVKEDSSISSKAQTVERIAPDEKATVTFTVVMNKKDLTSHPTISYTAGGKSGKPVTKDKMTIKYTKVYLTAALEAEKNGGQAGDLVKLTLKLKNTGKVDFEDVCVADDTLGELFTGLTVEAGKTVTKECEVTIRDDETNEYRFTVTGQDTNGSAVETVTNLVSLKRVTDEQVARVKVDLEMENEWVYELPTVMKARVHVTNEGAADLKNVSVQANGKTMFKFDLAAGETAFAERDIMVDMAGKFQFTAVVKDVLGENKVFESNIVELKFTHPTPKPTLVPLEAPVRPVLETPNTDDVEDHYELNATLHYAMLACGGVAAFLLLLAAAAMITRVVRKLRETKPLDTIDISSVRDYVAGATFSMPEEEPEQDAPVQEKPAEADQGESTEA